MTEKFTAFDAAEYLTDEADIAMYLEAAMEEAGDDPGVMAMVLADIARARNMSQLAGPRG